MTVLLTSLLIVFARITDVSLGTIRTIMVIQGRRAVAFSLGFFEVLIWVAVVSKIIREIDQPVYMLAYAIGFATGNFLGMTIEARLALGRQAVRVITRKGPELAHELRNRGFRVTQFDGYGRDGPVQEVFVEATRRDVPSVTKQARAVDPTCYYNIDDVRFASSSSAPTADSGGWRSFLKMK